MSVKIAVTGATPSVTRLIAISAAAGRATTAVRAARAPAPGHCARVSAMLPTPGKRRSPGPHGLALGARLLSSGVGLASLLGAPVPSERPRARTARARRCRTAALALRLRADRDNGRLALLRHFGLPLTRSIPHFGHLPGLSEETPGHMGHA